MGTGNNKGLVSSDAVVQFFLRQLFKENLIDTDAYVFALNMAKEESGKKNKLGKDIHAYSLCKH